MVRRSNERRKREERRVEPGRALRIQEGLHRRRSTVRTRCIQNRAVHVEDAPRLGDSPARVRQVRHGLVRIREQSVLPDRCDGI